MEKTEIPVVRFNQNKTHFVYSFGNNIFIFKLKKESVEMSKHIKMKEPVDLAEMLFDSNWVGIVFKDRRNVLIYDTNTNNVIGEIKYKQEILNLKLHKGRVIVVFYNSVKILNSNLEEISCFETHENHKGLIEVSSDEKNVIVCCPSVQKGYILVENLKEDDKNVEVRSINAHKGNIETFAVNRNGTLICSASDKGTLLRVFNVNGEMIREFRRGSFGAKITSISFSSDSKLICCISSNGTLHIFHLDSKENLKSTFSFVKKYTGLDYVDSEWSFAKYSFSNSDGEAHRICGFGLNKNIVNILTVSKENVKLTKLYFNVEKGGKPKKIIETKISARVKEIIEKESKKT